MAAREVERSEVYELVVRSREGDEHAFAKLVDRYQHEVFSVAMRMVANPTLADDVAQEAFVRAWRALDGFRHEAEFSTWLHRITVNTAITHRTRRSKKATTSLDDAPEVVERSTRLDPAAMGENWSLHEQLRVALSQIPSAQRQVVILKDVEGWSHLEIAEVLGISLSATKVRLHRAHVRLRKLLGEAEAS